MDIQIKNNRLVNGWYKASPNRGSPLDAPSLIVMHFTVSGAGPQGDADYFCDPRSKVSAHVVVGRDGSMLQVVPFNVKAWHAGVSIWRGVPNCNDYSIGIEVDNWGKLSRTADGQIRAPSGAPIAADQAVYLTEKHETAPAWWEVYPPAQLDAVEALTRALLATYPSIKEIVGHEDIAPGRKIDPGPAFPMSRFAALVGEGSDRPPQQRTVMATRLNARGGPGLAYGVIGDFTVGAKVKDRALR